MIVHVYTIQDVSFLRVNIVSERGKEEEEEEEEEEESAGLSVELSAESALQLTVTKTSLSIFTELIQVQRTECTHTTL